MHHIDIFKFEIQKTVRYVILQPNNFIHHFYYYTHDAAGLWAVVNNAGIALPSAPTDWLTIQDYKPMLAINLCGVIDVTLSVLQLIKKSRGRVVNVASVFGRLSPFGGPYCISKYGVEAFNDSLR